MEVKLGDTFYVPFSVVDPSTGLPSDGTAVTVSIFESGAGTAEAYAPTVTNRAADGNFTAPIAATGTNGFTSGLYYEAWASASFGTATYSAPITVFKVIEGVNVTQWAGAAIANPEPPTAAQIWEHDVGGGASMPAAGALRDTHEAAWRLANGLVAVYNIGATVAVTYTGTVTGDAYILPIVGDWDSNSLGRTLYSTAYVGLYEAGGWTEDVNWATNHGLNASDWNMIWLDIRSNTGSIGPGVLTITFSGTGFNTIVYEINIPLTFADGALRRYLTWDREGNLIDEMFETDVGYIGSKVPVASSNDVNVTQWDGTAISMSDLGGSGGGAELNVTDTVFYANGNVNYADFSNGRRLTYAYSGGTEGSTATLTWSDTP